MDTNVGYGTLVGERRSMRSDRRQGGKRAARTLVAIGLLALAPVFGMPRAEAAAARESVAELAERLSPAVVNISTTQTLRGDEVPGEEAEEPDLPFGGGPKPPGGAEKVQSLGSGFVIDSAGIILTNNHVIDGAEKIDVTFSDGTTLPAKLKGRDEKTDVAVLTVETKRPLPHVKLGDATKLRVGDWVIAIGNPFGLGGTVTSGIVSALNRDIHAGNYDDFIQTDAAINRGNSGGPLFSLDGDVVGMNTAIISPSGESVGIGFATPSSTIAPVVAQILKYGEIRRGWIGVRIQTVTPEIAGTLGLSDPRGALVAGVTPGGPAEASGIEAGDLITGFDGRPIHAMRDLPRIVAETAIGKNAAIEIVREGKERKLKIKVAKLPDTDRAMEEKVAAPPPALAKVKLLGLDLVAITPDIRALYKLDADAQGVLVTDVAPSSVAADKAIKPGDIVVGAAQAEVKTPKEIAAAVEEAKKAGRKSVLLRLRSGGAPRFVALPVE